MNPLLWVLVRGWNTAKCSCSEVSSDAKTLNRHYTRRKDLTALESYHGSNGFSLYTNNKVKSGTFCFILRRNTLLDAYSMKFHSDKWLFQVLAQPLQPQVRVQDLSQVEHSWTPNGNKDWFNFEIITRDKCVSEEKASGWTVNSREEELLVFLLLVTTDAC